MDRESISGVLAEGSIFTGVRWGSVTDSEFQGCTFIGSDLSEADIRDSRFIECRFERCNLSLCKPSDSLFGACHFEECRMLGIDWTRASWPRQPLYEANRFVRCDLSMGTFADLDLGPIGFNECRLRETGYRFARLAASDFEGSDCSGADFHGADLSGARLLGVTGLTIDPLSTKLTGATVDAQVAVAILESLGINLDTADSSYAAEHG